ncbi:hypothetical protein [Methylacidimicrobium sp. B4]|uniref:hypothetical protein n=1 Tax=Methylacidimicrobium sp. B4 TaxID=2796139 RepID=UPI001A8DA9DC|nr:hypothetical protein [Methylacidimicrobium sp. B4]QSR84994.1 hypothetical protein MacB4_01610 [Methylacidimicrobium sp. B4]
MGHIVAKDGVSWYDICMWDPSPEEQGIGWERVFVRIEKGELTVPWWSEPFGDREPAWTQLGLTLPEATEMAKQWIEKQIQMWGIEEVKRLTRRTYYSQRPIPKYAIVGRLAAYFPEEIEARKQLGLLPKDYVPPFTPEERKAIEEGSRRRYVPAERE